MSEYPLHIFTGSAHPQLAEEIARLLNLPLGKSTTRLLPDSETHVTIDEVVRDQDIYIVQPCSAPVNDHLIELLLYMDAFRRASAHTVNVVMPYFPYARQGGSVLKQIDALYEQGAEGKAYFAITHPVLLPSALKILDEDNRIAKLVVSNTIYIPPEHVHDKVEVISIAPLLADIIDRIHRGVSISEKLLLS